MFEHWDQLPCFIEAAENAVAIVPVTKQQLPALLEAESPATANWLKANDFQAELGDYCLLPTHEGALSQVMVGIDESDCLASLGALPGVLPAGDYYYTGSLAKQPLSFFAWALGSYRFEQFKASKQAIPQLMIPDLGADRALIEACYLARDLINFPAEQLGPMQLIACAEHLAKRHQAQCTVIQGEALLSERFPAIHTVGRASDRAPCLIDLTWGDPSQPSIVLVGKGVCFDTGGLDLKPSSAMRQMKKDMGGAAQVLGLAHAIMANQLPIHLRVLIPAVDNAVAGNAYRPGDVITMRNGLHVEIGNTDAEGRLVLADALTYATEQPLDLLIDFATLTGAARVAVGTEIAAYFTNVPELANQLNQAAEQVQEAVWQLPLHQPYRRLIKSHLADLNNSGEDRYAGASTAALFLESFVEKTTAWLHFDVMAYNTKTRPAHPEGGEAMGLRSVYQLLVNRYVAV